MIVRGGAWLVLIALTPGVGHAGDYVLRPAGSHLEFAATQQGAEFRGAFGRFDARINFDPASPGTGRIEAKVDLLSVNTRNDERDGYLRGADWFDTDRFPAAVFAANQIRATGGNGFTAEGKLTLRDITRPVRFDFTWAPSAPGQVQLRGRAALDRRDFGIGQGTWQDTQWVGAKVSVFVDVALISAAAPGTPALPSSPTSKTK